MIAARLAVSDRTRAIRLDAPRIVVGAGIAALIIPTLFSLMQGYWTTDAGAHGPLILVSGLWLLLRERDAVHWRPGSIPTPWLLLLGPLLLIYVTGRAFNLLGIQSAAAYLALVLLGFFYLGVPAMRRLWFVVLYLGFLAKPAEQLVFFATGPLQIALSAWSVGILRLFDYPVAHSGVRIQVAQYELLVAQACIGLGSMFSLMAIGLLYVHLASPTSKLHRAVLLLAVIPLSMVANWVRVMAIVLITYHAGDGVAQSFVHDLAGIATFLISLLGLFSLDVLLGLRRRVRS